MKHWLVQGMRRATQAGAIALVLGLVSLSLYGHYRAARALEDETYMKGWNGAVLAWIDRGMERVTDPQAFIDQNKGNLWSMRLAGWDLSDPLAAAEATAASGTLHLPLWVSILIPLIVTVLLGKVFCSWICPGNVFFELGGLLRLLLRFAEIPPGDVTFSRGNKYVFLVAGLGLTALVGLPIFTLVYPPAVLSRVAHAWIFGTSLTGLLAILGVLLAFEVCVSPRWWCRTMCPGGALYGVLGAGRLLRVRLDAGRCTGCRLCEDVCEPGLKPVKDSAGMECDNCGECIRVCGDLALGYSLVLPGRSQKGSRNPGSPATRSVSDNPGNGQALDGRPRGTWFGVPGSWLPHSRSNQAITNHDSPTTNHQLPTTNHETRPCEDSQNS